MQGSNEKEIPKHFWINILLGAALAITANIMVVSMYRMVDGIEEGFSTITFALSVIGLLAIGLLIRREIKRYGALQSKKEPEKTEEGLPSKKQLKETLPLLWNTYIHMHNDRRKLEDKVTQLFAVNTFLILVYLASIQILFIENNQVFEFFKKNILFGIALIFLIISFLWLLIKLIGRAQYVPWIEKKDINKVIKEDKFYHAIFDSIYQCGENTYHYRNEKIQAILGGLFFMYLAVTTIFIAGILYSVELPLEIEYFICSICLLVITVLFYKCYTVQLKEAFKLLR